MKTGTDTSAQARKNWLDKPLQLCVTIGVADAETLEPLPGAWTAAHELAAWARSQGYETLVFTDEPADNGTPNPVTVQRLRDAIEPWVSDPNLEKDRMILAFAGHGAHVGSRDLWLLNGWRTGTEEAIDVERARYRVESWNFGQVCLIHDACRTGIVRELDIAGTCLLPRGMCDDTAEVDVLLATGLGKPAFMAKAVGSNQAYCLFSRVIVDGLHGRIKYSVDDARSAVTSETLRRSVTVAIKSAASVFGEKQTSDIRSGFNRPRDIYTLIADLSGTGAPLVFEPPEPPQSAIGRTGRKRNASRVVARSAPPRPAMPKPPTVVRRLPSSREILGWEVARDAPPPPPTLASDSFLISRLIDQQEFGRGGIRPGQPRVSVSGGRVIACVNALGSRGHGQTDLLMASLVGRPLTTALELESGRWAIVSDLPDFSVNLVVEEEGVSGVLYRARHGSFQPDEFDTARAIASFGRSDISLTDALDLAAWVRVGKHADPVRGVLACALYARVGDIESIRRTAWYILQSRQALPPDVALLGRFRITQRDGRFFAAVPSATAKPPGSAAEATANYATTATPATEGEVAGLAPLLRQSWDLLELPRLPQTDALFELRSELTKATFTTLEALGGQRVARMIERGAV